MIKIKKQLIECVPNISEGRNDKIIEQIVCEIKKNENIALLHVDKGWSANRTVFTFIGTPEAVVETGFLLFKKTTELIDMQKHEGNHPKIGAVDVFPMIPFANISIDKVVKYTYQLAKKVGNELKIPVYCYEFSAFSQQRQRLERIRKGGYIGFNQKIKQPEWKPDFGPAEFNAQAGASVIGARKFLLAYNINLDTKSIDIAKKIAAEIRESGQTIIRNNQKIKIQGKLSHVKAIGWYVKEYGFAQVSTNITDFEQTGIHTVFETIQTTAQKYNTHVTGSELIGLIPEKALTDAGEYFLKKENNRNFDNIQQIKKAISVLQLNKLHKFVPEKRIIEKNPDLQKMR